MKDDTADGVLRGRSALAGLRSPRVLIGAAVTAAILVAGGLFLHHRATHVATNDARVGATMVTVSSEVSGRVVDVPVKFGDHVDAGQILARIEPRDSEIALAEIDANIAVLNAQAAQLRAQQDSIRHHVGGALDVSNAGVAEARAESAALQAGLDVALTDFERTRALYEDGFVSQARYEQDEAKLRTAEQNLQRAGASVRAAQAGVGVTGAELDQVAVLEEQIAAVEAQKAAMQAKRDQQTLDLERREIRAQFAGVIDGVFINPGEYVSPGTRVLLYHDPDAIWVDANVKETDFRKLALGAPAAVKVDAWPDADFTGEVIQLGAAATSEFALIPNPNPSGNFTKVTQRLPVRLAVTQQDERLRPGMMVEATIDAAH
jgi:membrane fusion protein (multidrug efflux system)